MFQMTNELLMAKKLRICDRTQAATFRSKFYCQGQKVHKIKWSGGETTYITNKKKIKREHGWFGNVIIIVLKSHFYRTGLDYHILALLFRLASVLTCELVKLKPIWELSQCLWK